MRDAFLPFAPPDLDERAVAEVVETLRSGWLTTGPRTRRFEEAFASYLGAEAALAVSSGTAALHVALLAHGIGPGDAVAVPAMTFSSAAHVVEHVGARPVFVDIEPETLNIDLSAAEAAIERSERQVRCIAPVHLYGQAVDGRHLLDLAATYDLVVTDDAAHALPARDGDRMVGGSGDARVLTAFSFYATKNLTTGEGGMLTGPRALVDEARRWVLHGMSRDAWRRNEDAAPWRYDVDRAGFKYNLTDIQSAIGLVQLERLPAMHARRTEIAQRYTAGFADTEEIELPRERDETTHAWHIYAVRLHLDRLSITRDVFIDELARRNIGSSVHFIPVHLLSYYAKSYDLAPDDLPVAAREFERLVSLPLHSRMTDEDIDDVIAAVSDIVEAHRR